MKMSLKTTASKYFSSLNPIAARICQDMEETKASYEELWDTLSEEQQEQLLSETIIKPEVLIKYDSSDISKVNGNKYSANENFAAKFVIDDHCSYRDEHSGPFTFRTRSQRDLTITDKNKKEMQQSPAVVCPSTKKIKKATNEIDGGLPRTGLDFLDDW